MYNKTVLKVFISGLFLILICIVGIIINWIGGDDEEKVLINLLTNPENMSLNTTREKNKYCSYQIVNGILYWDGKDGFCQYDFAEKKWETLWTGEIYNYKVVDKKVFTTEPSDDSGDENSWNILSRNLNDFNQKKVLVEKVYDEIFGEDYIYYSRIDEKSDKRYILQFDANTMKSTEVFSIDLKSDNKIKYEEMIAASEKYFVFCENDCVWIYNREVGQWNCFTMQFKENNLYFWIHDIQIGKTELYIQGLVCNNNKSSIAGYYVEKKSDKNGIWKIDLDTGQGKQMIKKIYYGGIYILNNVVYAIDKGKCEAIT